MTKTTGSNYGNTGGNTGGTKGSSTGGTSYGGNTGGNTGGNQGGGSKGSSTGGTSYGNTYLQDNWETVRGQVRTQWSQFTDNDIREIAGHREALVGKIQKTYGTSASDAQHQVEEFIKKVSSRG